MRSRVLFLTLLVTLGKLSAFPSASFYPLWNLSSSTLTLLVSYILQANKGGSTEEALEMAVAPVIGSCGPRPLLKMLLK